MRIQSITSPLVVFKIPCRADIQHIQQTRKRWLDLVCLEALARHVGDRTRSKACFCLRKLELVGEELNGKLLRSEQVTACGKRGGSRRRGSLS